MNKLITFWMILFLWTVLVNGCSNDSDSPEIKIESPWIRATGSGEMGGEHLGTPSTQAAAENAFNSAAYMTIRNLGDNEDRLIKVKCEIATAVELHTTVMSGEVMMMQPVESIRLPAGGQAILEPGGMHIMLIGIRKDLLAGQKIAMTLVLENAGEIPIQAEVRAP